jgi:NAD(P)-dependent dehydrogenase (short-subunit alcohol dehydrogenase family)
VDAAAQKVTTDYGRLDILVNNAGIVSMANPPSREKYREVLNTNAVGALSMTETFLDLLRKSDERRLVFVSSSVGSISQAADPASPYYSGNGFEYRSSKACLNMLIVLYWNRLQKDGFKVFGADPGLCATNFTGNTQSLTDRGAATPAQGGDRIATVVKGEKDADVGRVLGEYGVSPW